jgi:hypothetical protein
VSVLIDSSVWIGYFRGTSDVDAVDALIDENLVVINDIVLAELVPALELRGERPLAELLRQIRKPPLAVDWSELIAIQTACLRRGINRVGIPDLIIAQHAIQHGLRLYSDGRHFRLMAEHFPLALY